jgi:hypothetical protein
MRAGHLEPLVVDWPRRITRLEAPAHFGRDDVLSARASGKGCAQAALREPEPVVGSGVEIANAAQAASTVARACSSVMTR